MNNPQPEKNLMKRRIIIMVLAILLLFGGGSAGWFFLANRVEAGLNRQVERLAEQGKRIECERQRMEGFPFRIGLFCDRISFEDVRKKISFNAGNLRSAAQFYQPGFVVGELDGPAQLKLPDIGQIKLDWKLARSSSKLFLEGLKRFSLEIKDLTATGVADNGQIMPQTQLTLLELHFRPGGDDTGSRDIEAAITASDVRIENKSGNNLPQLNVKADAVLSEINIALKSGQDLAEWIMENGLKIQLHKLDVGLMDGGGFSTSGALSVGVDGLISGKLDLEITDIQTLVENFTAQNQQLGENAEFLRQASAIFAQGTVDKKARIQIQINKGAMFAGFIPLGVLPPLF